MFQIFKNILIEQNKEFIKDLAKQFHKKEDELLKKYLKPDYYLPMISKSKKV